MKPLLRTALRLSLPLLVGAAVTGCVVVPADGGYGHGHRRWHAQPEVVVMPPPVVLHPAPRPRHIVPGGGYRRFPGDDDRYPRGRFRDPQ